MDQFEGRTAIITGAASGMGLGMARTFARAGMNVVLCDIRREPLEAARAEVEALGARAVAVVADVSLRPDVERAAQAAVAAFGKIHVACNNAGVSMHGTPVERLSAKDWDWVIGVNLYGVIHGVQVFTPLIRAHGEPGHVVNTASIGGFRMQPKWNGGPYSMTKYAVVALSEALAQEVADAPIGVSVLAPASVATGIFDSGGARPQRLGGLTQRPENEQFTALIEDGLAPDVVGERVLDAIRADEFFIFTHPRNRAALDERHARIRAGFDACDAWWAARGEPVPR